MPDLTYLYPDEPVEPGDKIHFTRGCNVNLLSWFRDILSTVKLDYNNAEVTPHGEPDRLCTIKIAAITCGACPDVEKEINQRCKFIDVFDQPLVLSKLTYASFGRTSNTVWLEFSVTENPEKYRVQSRSSYVGTFTI